MDTDKHKRGWFFAFEGVDCAGKSTQLKLVAEKLRAIGYEVRETREPGGTVIGESIRKLLLDTKNKEMTGSLTNLLLHNAARRQSVMEVIAPNREAGKIILSDRCFISTLVYQCFAEGVDLDFAKMVCETVMAGYMPDKVFLLDIGIGEMRERLNIRGNAQGDRYDGMGLEFHNKIRNGYLNFCDYYPDLMEKIGAEKPRENVAIELICKIVSIVDGNHAYASPTGGHDETKEGTKNAD